jgi:protein-S-isoprenylcysteine O-methyltransferase Ste14
MSPTAYLLALLGYGVMYALPYVFFNKGNAGLRRFNLKWWLTALPFAAGPLALVLTWADRIPTHVLVAPGTTAAQALDLAAVPVLACAFALIAATLAIHRVPLALWHQGDDAPKSIVTYGPYKLVRHPFYVSFLLLLLGTAMLTREAIGLGSFLAGIAILEWTAAGEEKKLLASQFGDEYGAYKARTGRFVPRLSR